MAGFSGLGTILRVDDGGGFDDIAELTNIGGPTVTADPVDVSSHDSWRHNAIIGPCTFTNGTDTINAVAHELVNGEAVAFSLGLAGALPPELSLNRWYYVVNRAADTFQISLTFGGGVFGFSDDGAGVVNFFRAVPYREYAVALLDGGEISLEGNIFAIADAELLKDILDLRDEVDFEIEFPTSAPPPDPANDTWEFSGYITGFETSAPHDGKLSFSASIKVSGQPEIS